MRGDTLYQKPVESCPLCKGQRFIRVKEESVTGHKLYQDWMLPQIAWAGCVDCSHVFNRHCFTEEGFRKLFDKPALDSECPAKRPQRDRLIMARLIERAWLYIPVPCEQCNVRWLDIGFGNGALIATAEEYGYDVMGIDTRPNAVEELRAQGYAAGFFGLMDFRPLGCSGYDVVSMLDVLEHIPDPAAAVKHVYAELLKPGGTFIVSTPNMECDDWRRGGAEAYWREVEHLHNFSRRSLMSLLRGEGFSILHYHPSERYIAGMEIVCRKGL